MKTCLVLTLRWPCIVSTSNRTPNQLNSSNDGFTPTLWRQLKTEVYKLIECGFIWEEQHSDWVANIAPILKKNGRSGSALTFGISMTLVLKTNFRCQTRVVSKGCPSWMAIQGTIKLKYTQRMKSICRSKNRGGVLLYGDALWFEERPCNLSTRNEHNFSWPFTKDSRMLCWRHCY